MVVGSTPLLFAANNGYNDIVLFLLQKGANIENKDNGGNTALILASKEGKTGLIHASGNLNYGVVVKLIENEVKLDIQDRHGKTALMHASHNIDIVKCLINAGASIDIQHRKNGNTALIDAVFRKDIEMVDTLIKGGANLELINYCENSALLLAYKHNKHDIFELLINGGANIEIKYSNNDTLLFLACKKLNERIILTLHKKDADFFCKNDDNESPIEILQYYDGLSPILKSLIEKIKLEKTINEELLDYGNSL